MNRRQARAFALFLIIGESDNLLGFDSGWPDGYSDKDAERIERELESIFDLLQRKLDRLEKPLDKPAEIGYT